MKTRLAVALVAGTLALIGCAENALVAREATVSGIEYGTVGIWGDNNTRTIQRQSRLDKISVVGDGNTVFVEDEVLLSKVEIWGKNNTISIPEGLAVRRSFVGKNNNLMERPRAFATTPPASPPAALSDDVDDTTFRPVTDDEEPAPTGDEPTSP